MKRTLLAVVAACSLGSPPEARADEVDTLGAKVIELDARVYELNAQLKPPPEPGPEVAERRLIDAQVLYELKNYESASIILLDVVEKYPNSPAYPEALFYLADSLYLKRDFLSSRRFFEKVVDLGPSGRRYQESLQRLIELSLHTGDYSPVDGYISKLEALSTDKQLPSVPYVKGKYFYFRRQFDKAIDALKGIGPNHEYYFHALYFVGASNVAQGQDKIEQARSAFATILKLEPDPKDKNAKPLSDAQKLIVELAHMALARIYYDQGALKNSLDEYEKIQQKSDLFNDALYEGAWVNIKGKDYLAARRKLDLLMLNAPDTPLAPEVKLLIGSLHIRQEAYGPATDAFTKARDEYAPIQKQLADELTKTGSDAGYFRDLIAKNLAKFDIAAVLPTGAVKYVKDEPDVVKLGQVIGDVNDLKKSLDECDETVARLERTLNSPARVNVFPELATARTKAVEVSNELIEIKRTLGNKENELIAPIAGNEKATLTGLAAERQLLEAKIAQMQTKDASIAVRIMKAREAFNELDKRAVEMATELKGLRDTIDAAIKLASEGKKAADLPAPPTAAPVNTAPVKVEGTYAARIQAFDDKLAALRAKMADVHAAAAKIKDAVLAGNAQKADLEAARALGAAQHAGIEELRRELEESAMSVGVDDSDMQVRAQLKAQYDDLLKRQHELSSSVRSRLSQSERVKAEQIESILERARGVDTKITSFNARIDEILDARLKDIMSALTDEKAHVLAYRQTLAGYTGESAHVGGGVVADSFKAVADRFYNVVVRADVGIIDVAWALKDSATRESNRLVAERKRELKLLDDEFKEVMKEQQ
jgi:tetratricopeptide (TPR) repeat protein